MLHILIPQGFPSREHIKQSLPMPYELPWDFGLTEFFCFLHGRQSMKWVCSLITLKVTLVRGMR